MAIMPALQNLLRESPLSFEELRAFEAGLETLDENEQKDFYIHLSQDPSLVYPIYIHYKAKVRAINEGEREWESAIEREVQELEEYMAKKRVGDEIA
jgi:hypothetical protein